MRVFFFLCVQQFHAMLHWLRIQSNLFVRAFSQFVHTQSRPVKRNQLVQAQSQCWNHEFHRFIDLLCIARNETSKVPDFACLRVALRHIWEIHLIVVSLRAFGVCNIVLKLESSLAKMYFVFCAVFLRHIHKLIGFIHVLPNDLTQGDRLAPV